MSADNWRICPRCKVLRAKEIAEKSKEISVSYGNVSQEEWEVLKKSLGDLMAKELDENFREDYELGVDQNGLFYIRYRGYCEDCGFSFDCDYEKRLDIS